MSKSKNTSRLHTHWDDEYWMKSNDFYCGFNMPDALEGEEEHGLPPYAKRRAFLVDEYPSCPENWMRSSGTTSSYFLGVQKDKGLWLDFNKNWDKKYHVAIVISIQGVNPITGLPCKDAHLEQYIEKCPKCNKEFGANRYCEGCGFRWPKQNYISTTATPDGMLWLDGFRSIDGIVRQYLLTEDKVRGVAYNVLNRPQDRVFAIGVSFFLSKNPKPVVMQPHAYRGGLVEKYHCVATKGSIDTPDLVMGHWNRAAFFSPTHTPEDWVNCSSSSSVESCSSSSSSPKESIYKLSYLDTGDIDISEDEAMDDIELDDICGTLHERCVDELDVITENQLGDVRIDSEKVIVEKQLGDTKGLMTTASPVRRVKTKKMEVGAGANIRQAVYDDPEPLDYWRDNPEAIICINYVEESDAIKIINQGKIDLSGHKEGFLQKVPVGN